MKAESAVGAIPREVGDGLQRLEVLDGRMPTLSPVNHRLMKHYQDNQNTRSAARRAVGSCEVDK